MNWPRRPVSARSASAEALANGRGRNYGMPVEGRHLLVVDDDAGIRDVVRAYAARDGYRVTEAADGHEAQRVVEQDRPDLVVLDLMVPGIDGWELCRRWRASDGPPIVMLTARGAESERILGLGLGADDYVTKPFSPLELMARIASVLRRSAIADAAEGEGGTRGRYADIVIDLDRRLATIGGEVAELTRRQLDLLARLVRNADRVSTRLELLEVLGDGDVAATDRAVDQHMVAIRRALATAGSASRVESVRGIGYRLVPGQS
jgi:DNA-binding response OmpR family regulator